MLVTIHPRICLPVWYLKTYRLNCTGILFSILYGHETWSVTLTEEHSLSVFVEGAEKDV